jgi:protein SCO1
MWRGFAAVIFAVTAAGASAQAAADQSGTVGIEERLGARAALDARLVDENGTAVRLGDLVHGPTILALVYYRCPNVCSTLLLGLSGVVGATADRAGRDFRVVTISIDERETPEDARWARKIALETVGTPLPDGTWRFLTGSAEAVAEVARSLGYRYTRRGDYIDHPVGIVILSPSGRIVRYMYGADFLPADLGMSVLEASAGTVRPTIAKVLRVCFGYDPASRRYVFKTLQVSAVVIGGLVAALAIVLLVTGSRRRRRAAARSAQGGPP